MMENIYKPDLMEVLAASADKRRQIVRIRFKDEEKARSSTFAWGNSASIPSSATASPLSISAPVPTGKLHRVLFPQDR
jgi:hypothetical protein